MAVDFKIGDQLGRLTLVDYDPNRNVWQMARFDCACGTKGLLRRLWYWLDGNTRSCGCMRRKADGAAQIKFHWHRTRLSAKKRKLPFALTLEEFAAVVKQSCSYCGAEPVFHQNSTYATGAAVSGIDRIRNELGYVSGNVVACCWLCNRAKHEMTVDAFKAWLARAANHLGVCR